MPRLLTRSSLSLLLFAAPLLVSFLFPDRSETSPPHETADCQDQITGLVTTLQTDLSISQEISIEILPRVDKLVSIQPLDARKESFVLRFDRAFLARLESHELKAVVAHELGHLLIFTHHPYLQTEQLANRHALKVVSRESLRSAYTKVWDQTGQAGSMDDFLGL